MFEPKRRADWPDRLTLATDEHRKGQFQFGQYDCATYFSDVAFAMTDADPFEAFGSWRCERSALRCLARTGHPSVKAYLDSVLPAISPLSVRRGDAGYAANFGPLSCPFVVVGSEAISRDHTGWLAVPITHLICAYRIGT